MYMLRQQIVPRRVIVLVLLLLVGAATWILFRSAPAPVLVNIGHLRQFPPGSVTPVQLQTSFIDTTRLPNGMTVDHTTMSFGQRLLETTKMQWNRREQSVVGDVSPVLVQVVNDPQQGVIAHYARDPQSTCLVPWQESEEHFVDPCHGSAYSYTGEYVRGPSWRGLDRFAVQINARGEVIVNVGTLLSGKRVW
jgi:hypothetical protein